MQFSKGYAVGGGIFNPVAFFKDKFVSTDRLENKMSFYKQATSSGVRGKQFTISQVSSNFNKLTSNGNTFGLTERDVEIAKDYFHTLDKTGKSMEELPLKQYVEQTKGIGYGATKASVAFNALKTAAKSFGTALASAAWQAAVMFVIGQVIAKVSDLILTAKEAKQALDEFNDSFKELNNTISEGKKKLPDLEKTYWELADGVDSLGNNVSLTEQQYETYLQTVEDIHEIIPSLSTYFNEQGQAIGFVKSEMKGLNDQYKQYEQNQIHERWFTKEDDGRTKAEKAIKGINDKTMKDFHNEGGVVFDHGDFDTVKKLSKYNKDELYDYLNNLSEDDTVPYKELKQISFLPGVGRIFYDAKDGQGIAIHTERYGKEKSKDMLFNSVQNVYKEKKGIIDDNNVNIRNLMTAYAKNADEYSTMSGTESEDLVNFINSFDFATMFTKRSDVDGRPIPLSDEEYKGLAAQLIKGVQVEGFSEAFHNVLDDDKISTMSYKDAEKFVDKNLETIRTAIGWKKKSDELLNFKATLGFEANDEELFKDASKNTGIPVEKIKELFTKGEIELIANVDFKPSGSGEDGKYTEDEYDKAEADVKNYAEVKNAQSELDTADNKLKSSLKTIENYGTHYGKIVEMVNGTRFITDPKELNELLEALPELKDHLKYTESGWMLEAEAMDGVQKSVLSLQQAYVEAQQILSDSAVQGAMTRMKVIPEELASITSVVDAYKLLAQKIPGGITFTATGELDTSKMTNDGKLTADGILAQLRLSQAQKVMQKTAKLSAESAKEDRKKQIKDLKDQQYLADLQHQFEKINQTLEEFTKQLEILKKAQDDLFESDYIGKLDYINQRYETQNNQVEETQKSLDELLAMQPETAQGWNELATTVENLSTKLFEGKRALIDYQVELSQTYMNGLKAIGEASKSVLEDSNSQYDRNVKMLKEGGLGGLQFRLTPITPKDAVEKQREENKKLAKEEEAYQEKVNQIKKRALDEMKAYEDAERARQLADLTSEASEAMASLNEDFWKAMNIGWSDFKELIEAEGIDVNINWSGISSSSKSDMKRLYADQHGIEIIENPERKKGDKGTGWKYKTADGAEFENIEQARAHTNELIISGNSKAGTRTQLGKDLGFTVKKAKDGSNEYIYTTSKGTEVKYGDLNSLKTVFKNLDNKSDGTSKEIFCNYFGVTIDKTNPIDWKYTYQGNTKENIEDIKKLVTTNTGVSFKAKGGDATGDILVNEEGQESYLGKDGKLHLFKPGAQFFNTDEVIRVFNAEDTKKIRKYTGDKYFNEPVGDLSKVTQLANGNIHAIFPTISPENANDATSNDTIGETTEKATEEHYDRMGDIQNKALNEEIAMDAEAQAITEVQKEQHYDKMEIAQQTTNDITSQEQIVDNAEKVTEEKRFSTETEGVVTELLNWMKNNPIKAPGLDTASWKQMISDAQGYMSQLMGGFGTGVRGEINGDMPYYNQGDYSAYTYGGKPMNTNACAPTSMAMVLSYLGKNVNPVEAAKYSEKNGFYTSGQGTSWGLFDSMAKAYGVNCDTIGSSSSAIISSLKAGRPVIVSVNGGTFNPSGRGHLFVLAGIDDNGKIIVNDPGSRERTSKTWDISAITSNARNAWSFYATGTKDYGVAGENYKKEFLIDKKTGQWTEVNSPTLIDTNEVDVVGEKASAKIDKPLPMYANGTLDFGNLDVISQMPKLGNDQIEHILRTKFKNSPLITDSNIASVVDGISKAQAQSGISALVILSIAGWESGWGTSAIAKQKGNFWGWGAYDSDPMGTAVTFNSDIGQAAQDYANKLKATYYDGYGFKTLNQMSNGKGSDHLYAYAAQSSKWGANNSQIIKELVTGLENSGLTDFTADIVSSTATTASNTTSIRRSFDSQFRDFIKGANGVSSSSSVEDSLMNYIKANTEISTDSTEKFIEAFEGLNTYKDSMEPYFEKKREEVRNANGTPEFTALANAYNKEHSEYIETVMGYSTDMTVAQAKAQYKLSEDAVKAGYKYYNERKNAGASATELMEITTILGKMEKIAEEYSDAYVQAISAETDFLVSRTKRTLNAFDNERSWLDKDLERAEGDTVKQAEIYGKKNDVSKRAMDAAHQRALDIQQDEDYADIFSTYDVESWFDANGELTSKFYEDVEGASSELIPYMNQLAEVLGVCKKDWYENAEAIEDNNEAMADLKIKEYIKYQERLVKALDFDATLSQSLSTAKEGMYNIFKTLRDKRAEMEKELKANMQIDDWLTEDTRKLLFNLDDYEEQMGVINDIQAEAEKLYINYQNELAGLKEDELYKEEEITAEYNRQLEKLQDRLSIAKADLQLAKDKAAFENALRERDTQIIMGNRVQNVADPERLREAAMKMAESESNLENEKTTSAENQDIRNMEAATGMINQEKAAIQNRIEMINGMTEEERRVFADFLEPLQAYRNKLLALTKTNPYRIITGDNSNSVFASRDYSKIAGYSLTQDHSAAVDEIQYLLDNGYYKPGTAEYDIALKTIDFLKKQHDDKTTSDAHNYGYELYDPANSINWYRYMKMYTDAGYAIQSQERPSIDGIMSQAYEDTANNLPVISGEGDVLLPNGSMPNITGDGDVIINSPLPTVSSFLDGYEELDGVSMLQQTLGVDEDAASAIFENLKVGTIAPSVDAFENLAKMGAMWEMASGVVGNTDNSINMQEAHFHITEPVQDANGVMTHFVRQLEMERSTTNNQR